MPTDMITIALVALVALLSAVQFFRPRQPVSPDNSSLTQELKAQIASISKELESQKTTNTSLNDTLRDKEVVIAELQKDLTRAVEQHKSASDELSVVKTEVESLKSVNTEIRESLSAAKNDVQNGVSKIADLEKTIENLASEKKELLQKIEQLSSELAKASEQKVQLSSELSALTTARGEEQARFAIREGELASDIEARKAEIAELKKQLISLGEEKNQIIAQNVGLKSEYEAQKQKQEELLGAFEEQKKSLREEMSNTMQKILESKITKFDETSTKALEALLKPFRENIDGFRKKVEESQKESGERIVALSKEIEQVMKAGLSITAEAANLAKALKGEKQTQGRWGEMVLESVLEHSGLIKGDHFFIQESYKDEEGKDKRPDVVVRLPQDRSIIIDSKVSLVDYDRFLGAQSEEERTICSALIAKAFKNHIDTLHSKDYAAYNAGTLQYVFMFVPIEAVYAVAVGQDPSLYEYALKKHIIIVYPSTLVVTLKTIYMYWQRESSDKAVETLFLEAGKLYDKVYGFVETFEKVGRQLETLSGSYQEATKQLYGGSGNLVKRAESLRLLGAKTTKNMKTLKLKNRDFSEDDLEIEIIKDEAALTQNVDTVIAQDSHTEA